MGTDTMAYTATALSFMLENLGKPVVFTGSQVPIGEFGCLVHHSLLRSTELSHLVVNLCMVCRFAGGRSRTSQ
jgi:L-asparaginase